MLEPLDREDGERGRQGRAEETRHVDDRQREDHHCGERKPDTPVDERQHQIDPCCGASVAKAAAGIDQPPCRQCRQRGKADEKQERDLLGEQRKDECPAIGVGHQGECRRPVEACQPWRNQPHEPAGRRQKKQDADGNRAWWDGDDRAADSSDPAAGAGAGECRQYGETRGQRQRRRCQRYAKGQGDGGCKAGRGKRIAHRLP